MQDNNIIKDELLNLVEMSAGINQINKYVKKFAFNSPKFAEVHSQYK
jgi:hypothetical protein